MRKKTTGHCKWQQCGIWRGMRVLWRVWLLRKELNSDFNHYRK